MTLPSIYDQLKDDWEVFDGVETVTLTPNTVNPQADAANAVTTVKALAVMPPVRAMMGGDTEFVAGLGVTKLTQIWSLWDSTLNGLRPAPGWKITDNEGNVWTIKARNRNTFKTRWRCMCEIEK